MKTANQEEETPSSAQRFKVAVVQAAPVVFDRERTLEKVHVLSGEAARKGARLVLSLAKTLADRRINSLQQYFQSLI